MKRKCNKCKQDKELDQFKFRSDNKYDCYCISCRKEYQHESYMSRRETQIKKNSEYRKQNPTKDWFSKHLRIFQFFKTDGSPVAQPG